MEKISYIPEGVCSRKMEIEVDGDIITAVNISGGCAGNTQGVSKLLIGMKIDDAIERLEGIRCGFKSTSCPDQLARALSRYKNKKAQ